MIILKGKKEQRLTHWQEIATRVTTHEGEFLYGEAGRKYQQKYSKKHLGKDLAKPINYNQVSYLQELNKTP